MKKDSDNMNKKYLLNHGLELRISVLESALSQLGQGIVLLSKEGRVEFETSVASQLVQRNDGLFIQSGKLTCTLEPDNERFQRMRKLVLHESEVDASYKSFYIHRDNQKKPYLLLLSKLSLDVDHDKDNEHVLVIIKDTHANTEYWQERLKDLFGLTNREADFVVLLTEGRDIREISGVMNIAEDTVRQYLKSCFKKMEVNKQHELVCLALDSVRKR